MHDESVITITGNDGIAHSCRILSIFEFRSREYALLLMISNDDATRTVLMQYVKEQGNAVFRAIEDDQEYEDVLTFVKSLQPNT